MCTECVYYVCAACVYVCSVCACNVCGQCVVMRVCSMCMCLCCVYVQRMYKCVQRVHVFVHCLYSVYCTILAVKQQQIFLYATYFEPWE